MADFNELLKKADKLNNVVAADADSIDTFDRSVLDGFGLVFELAFGHIFGFQWLRKLISYIPGTAYRLPLPYLNYRFSVSTKYDAEEIKEKLNYNALYYHNEIINFCSIYEMPFILLHWAVAHIGKVTGWLVASPFALSGYIGKKLYYGTKEAFARNGFQKESAKFEPIDLAAKWFMQVDGRYLVNAYAKDFVSSISPRQMLDGIFSNIDNTLRIGNGLVECNYFDYLCKPDNLYGLYSHVDDRWKTYQETREKHFESQRKWALAKTILSGLLIIPLFFTIPSYKKLVSLAASEKQEIDKIAKDFKDQKDPRFSYGEILFGDANIEKGMKIFSKVPEHSQRYGDAMSELGHASLAIGKTQDAATCFEKSKETRAQFIAATLAANPDMNLEELFSLEEKTDAVAVTLSYSSGIVLARSGIFAHQDIITGNLAEIQGLDVDNDVPGENFRLPSQPTI